MSFVALSSDVLMDLVLYVSGTGNVTPLQFALIEKNAPDRPSRKLK